MSLPVSAGKRFRQAIETEVPLQIAGVIHPLAALQAERAGFKAIYLSGAGVANASCGLPDLGVTNLSDVAEDARRITRRVSLPLLVDIDTGWGSELSIARTIQTLEQAGVAAVHMEDQVAEKRCGHRPNKQLVAPEEMQARIRAAVAARTDSDFVIMARTDAAAGEGLDAAIARANAYVAAGADMIFAEALHTLEDFAAFARAVDVPILANITEFGKTPMLTTEELRRAGVRMALYPLTAFRAMNAAAEHVFQVLRRNGSQSEVIDRLQTRDELYDLLDYHAAERTIDNQTASPKQTAT